MNRSATFLLSQYVWELLGGSLAQLHRFNDCGNSS
jgi:hypothetical protein